jgi:hypothetical protein
MNEKKEPLEIGDLVVLEDNSTVFGPMSVDEGSTGMVRNVYYEYESYLNKRYEKIAVEWLTGNMKGTTDEHLFANRFKKVSRPSLDLLPRYAHLEGKIDSVQRNSLSRIWMRLRGWMSSNRDMRI